MTKEEKLEIIDTAICRILSAAYYGANRAEDEENMGMLPYKTDIVGGAENVLRKAIFGTHEQFLAACKREGYGIDRRSLH